MHQALKFQQEQIFPTAAWKPNNFFENCSDNDEYRWIVKFKCANWVSNKHFNLQGQFSIHKDRKFKYVVSVGSGKQHQNAAKVRRAEQKPWSVISGK